MATNIPLVANTDTWFKLFNTVNLIANVISNSAITVGSNTVGNAGVTGNFYANSLLANSLTVNNANISVINSNNIFLSNSISFGNSTVNSFINTTSIGFANPNSSLNISVPTSNQISNGQFFLNANGNFTTVPSVSYPISNSVITTNGQFIQIIDYWFSNTYNLANYNVVVIDNVSNNFVSTHISLLSCANNVEITDYSYLKTNNSIGSFSASSNSTCAILNFTPSSNSTTIKFFRELI